MEKTNYKIYYLANGIPLLVDELPQLNSATLGIYVKAGSKYEKADLAGVSHLLEHMMFKGTKTRDTKEISEFIDDLGGMMNAYTSKEITSYYIQMIASKLKEGVSLLNDLFLNSTFTEENLAKEKKVVVEEIRMYEDIPEERIHDLNSTKTIKTPHSNLILGSEESVNGITREALITYFKNSYTSDKIFISVAGKVDVEEIIAELNKGLGKLPKSTTPLPETSKLQLMNHITKVSEKTNQVHLCFNTMGLASIDKRKYTLAVIASILGGNMSSRLFHKIREELGLAYSVYSYLSSYKEGGVLTIYAGTTKESYQEVIEIIREELNLIARKGISEKELDRAKNQFIGMRTFGLENSKSRMGNIATQYLLYGELLSEESILKRISDIRVEDVKDLAKELFDEKYYSTTVLGDI